MAFLLGVEYTSIIHVPVQFVRPSVTVHGLIKNATCMIRIFIGQFCLADYFARYVALIKNIR